MKFKLKDVLPNPFRDLEANPLIEEKIEELVGSIALTGFWDNVVVRINAQKNPELAYGHHRLAAAIRAGIVEADFIVKKLSDAMMIQIMDSENRETYGSTPLSLIESVKAVVKSLAKGTIPAFVLDPRVRKDNVRYAPSFIPGEGDVGGTSPQIAYTAMNIAEFLGRIEAKGGDRKKPEDCIVAALNALHLKEEGHFSDDLLVTKDRTGAKVPITTNELLRITNDIKRNTKHAEVTRTKSQTAVNAWVNKQKELEEEIKARAAKEKAAHEELIRKQTAAKLEEDTKAIKLLAQKIREQTAAAKEKALADVDSMKAIEAKLAVAKEKALAAFKEDAYAPVRRDVERLLFKMNNVSTGSFCEDIKSISKLPLTVKDRQRVWEAAQALGEWYLGWVSAQVSTTVLSGKKELKEMKSREVANRRKAEAAARAVQYLRFGGRRAQGLSFPETPSNLEETERKERVAAKAVTAKAAKAAKETK